MTVSVWMDMWRMAPSAWVSNISNILYNIPSVDVFFIIQMLTSVMKVLMIATWMLIVWILLEVSSACAVLVTLVMGLRTVQVKEISLFYQMTYRMRVSMQLWIFHSQISMSVIWVCLSVMWMHTVRTLSAAMTVSVRMAMWKMTPSAWVSNICNIDSVWLPTMQFSPLHNSDVDECDEGTDSCHVNADCMDTIGSFQCTCSVGYSGDGIENCTGKGSIHSDKHKLII